MEPIITQQKPKFFKRRSVKIVYWTLAIISLLIMISLLFANWYISKSHPELDSSVIEAKISSEVNVIRDNQGVAKIQATNAEDLFYTQGYVMAQDRLFQMDMTRRLAGGRLAEVVGEVALESDQFFRTYGMHRTVDDLVAEFNEETTMMVEAFAAGVTAYINDSFESGKQPLEFRILGYEPEPWTPEDTAIAVKYMGYTLTGNFSQELENYQLVKMFGEDGGHLFPEYNISSDFPTIYDHETGEVNLDNHDENSHAAVLAFLEENTDEFFNDQALDDLISFSPSEWNGSNNWVISGDYTESGYPLIADDPHLGLAIPSVWYQTHLDLEDDFHSIGVTVPGIPGVVLGHNGHVSWGVTSLSADYEDVFLERINPENPIEYLYDDKWEEATIIHEKIYISGEDEPIDHPVELTRNGPVMNKVSGEDTDQAFSLKWSGVEAGQELNGILRLNRSTNADEFLDGLEGFVTPGLSWIFADTNGNIGYRGQGLLPIRQQSDGRFPVPGWDPDYQWDGFIPTDELPTVMNPDSGYIMTANHKPVGDDYDYEIGRSFFPYRGLRLKEMIENQINTGDDFTLEDMGRMQLDFTNTQARALLPLMLEAMVEWDHEIDSAESIDGEMLGELDEIEQDVFQSLRQWDFREEVDSSDALVWQIWYESLSKNLFERYLNIELTNHLTIHRVLIDAAEHDNLTMFAFLDEEWHQSFPQVARETFYDAVEHAKELQGPSPQDWRWGDWHAMEIEHPLGSVWPLNLFLNLGSWEIGGSGATPGAASYNSETGVANHAAGWRFIGDLSSENAFYDVMIPGQSGQWRSPHYDDQIETWVKGEYSQMIYDKQIEDNLGHVRFVPEE